MKLCEKVLNLLKEKEADIPVFLGGIIPEDDIPALKEMGIKEVFGPGTPLETIIGKVKEIAISKEA